MEKILSDITRQEWIAFRWIEAPQSMGDEERIFISSGRRTPDESMQAMEDWDLTAEERDIGIAGSIDNEGFTGLEEPEDEKGIIQ